MTPISPDTMVSALAAELPGAAEVFRARGINFCCGGNRALSEAALKAGLPTERLVADLQALADAAAVEAPEATPALIDHIVTRYHQTHRDELHWLIPLAQRVERVHGDHEDAPLGLTEALIALQDDLEAQMAREESGLFAQMRQDETPMLGAPIAQTRREHQDTARLLAGIEHVTHGLSLPVGACGSWSALYTGLRKLSEDLVAHRHLENTVLFARFDPAPV